MNNQSSNYPPHQPSSKGELLDELESIKDLLEESSLDEDDLDAGLDIDIPILDDVVGDDPSSSNPLLDLKSIFDDDEELDTDDIDDGDIPHRNSENLDTTHSETAAAATVEDHEHQLDLEGLDTEIEIPTFKLTLGTTEAIVDEPANAEVQVSELLLSTDADVHTPDHPVPAMPEDVTNTGNNASTADPSPTTAASALLQITSMDTSFDKHALPPQDDSPSAASPFAHIDLDQLVQELVDEFIPVIESRLRQRLAHYPDDIIRQLAEKHLKN